MEVHLLDGTERRNFRPLIYLTRGFWLADRAAQRKEDDQFPARRLFIRRKHIRPRLAAGGPQFKMFSLLIIISGGSGGKKKKK